MDWVWDCTILKIATERKDVMDCLRDMLELWLNQSYDVIKYGEPSWQMLENAVRARAGRNNPAVADKIHRKYILHKSIRVC